MNEEKKKIIELINMGKNSNRFELKEKDITIKDKNNIKIDSENKN